MAFRLLVKTPFSLSSISALVLIFLILLPCGCTVFQPVEVSTSDAFFCADAPVPKDGSCKEGAGAYPQTYIPNDKELDGYVGKLGHEIWITDRRRLELARRAVERTNIASAYNVLLWPIGGWLISSSFHDPSRSLLIDAGVAASAIYGLLSSGIPDRDKLYLNASSRMACAIAMAAVDLVPRNEFDATGSCTSNGKCESVSHHRLTLENALWNLDYAIGRFSDERKALILHLQPLGKSLVAAKTAEVDILDRPTERRYAEVMRKPLAASSGSGESIPRFQAMSLRRLQEAQGVRDHLDELRRRLLDAGRKLNERRRRIDADLRAALIARSPAIDDLTMVLGQINTRLSKQEHEVAVVTARVKAEKPLSAQGSAMPGEVSRAAISGLSATSRNKLIAFEEGPGLMLDRAVRAADEHLRADDGRRKAFREETSLSGCRDSQVSEFWRGRTSAEVAPTASSAGNGEGLVRRLQSR